MTDESDGAVDREYMLGYTSQHLYYATQQLMFTAAATVSAGLLIEVFAGPSVQPFSHVLYGIFVGLLFASWTLVRRRNTVMDARDRGEKA